MIFTIECKHCPMIRRSGKIVNSASHATIKWLDIWCLFVIEIRINVNFWWLTNEAVAKFSNIRELQLIREIDHTKFYVDAFECVFVLANAKKGFEFIFIPLQLQTHVPNVPSSNDERMKKQQKETNQLTHTHTHIRISRQTKRHDSNILNASKSENEMKWNGLNVPVGSDLVTLTWERVRDMLRTGLRNGFDCHAFNVIGYACMWRKMYFLTTLPAIASTITEREEKWRWGQECEWERERKYVHGNTK